MIGLSYKPTGGKFLGKEREKKKGEKANRDSTNWQLSWVNQAKALVVGQSVTGKWQR